MFIITRMTEESYQGQVFTYAHMMQQSQIQIGSYLSKGNIVGYTGNTPGMLGDRVVGYYLHIDIDNLFYGMYEFNY